MNALHSLAPVVLVIMQAAPPPAPLTVAETGRLLDAHVCVMAEHAPIGAAGFEDALRAHLWSLPSGATHRALTYIEQHKLAGFSAVLITELHTRDATAQSFVAGALLRVPDPPSPEALWGEARKVGEPVLRARFARALERTGPPERVLRALHEARAAETDARTRRSIELVAAKLGDGPSFDALAKALPTLDVEDVRAVLHDMNELAPAPSLAPLLSAWLDDERAVGTMSHRATRPYLVRDHAVWTMQVLGVALDPPLTSIVYADAALVRRAKAALKRAPRPSPAR